SLFLSLFSLSVSPPLFLPRLVMCYVTVSAQQYFSFSISICFSFLVLFPPFNLSISLPISLSLLPSHCIYVCMYISTSLFLPSPSLLPSPPRSLPTPSSCQTSHIPPLPCHSSRLGELKEWSVYVCACVC